MILPETAWNEVNSSSITSKELISIMKEYSKMGLTLYVGSDSMLNSNYCTFSCIIAVHSNDLGIANYYFQKQNLYEERYKQLENKILKEIEISIMTANYLKLHIPKSIIEVHVDIGDKDRNATRYLVDNAKGWILGMGYKVKIKPDSWASSVADWHTK
jgi:uncharacterized protein